MANSNSWQVLDKQRLFRLVMDELAGNARVSFEGDLQGFRLGRLHGASGEETDCLKRNTRWPEQDFVVVPLEEGSAILSAIDGAVSRRIFYVQIEKSGVLQFGAYDNFRCIVFGNMLSQRFLETLVSQGVIKTA